MSTEGELPAYDQLKVIPKQGCADEKERRGQFDQFAKNYFFFTEAATTKVEDSEGNSGSRTTEVVESEESGSSEESGESEESGDWEESGESGESGDYEDSEESGDSNISKRDEIPKEQGRYTERLC